ncbi:MAG: hypothetical protein LBR79_05345 [Oscillospiraceae bacterium]|jgi:ssDNA-binding Zn-finger/Zn-ribbon topoisomerase 1|nr:hypothetical protein [Oscillospiraceae bacterium]
MPYKKNNLTNGIQKLDDEDIESVTGGINMVYNLGGHNDIADCTCPKCGFKEDANQTRGDGTCKSEWMCPQCHTKSLIIFMGAAPPVTVSIYDDIKNP